MLLYLLCMIVCFLIDYKVVPQRIKKIFILLIYFFLCFGYMTGSDWRIYELMYDGQISLGRIQDAGEIGFIYILQYAHSVIHDFWVFSALIKIIYILLLTKVAGIFTSYKYSVLGVSFGLYTLFMVISCPYRFLIASIFVLAGILVYMKYSWKYALLFFLAAPLFHISTLVVILFFIPIPKFVDCVSKINNNKLVLFMMISIIISSLPFTKVFIYQTIIPIFGMEAKGEYYSDYDMMAWLSFGTLKFFLVFAVIISNKKNIISKSPLGKYVYYYSVTILLLQPFFHALPTGQRLVIIPLLFVAIALVIIINSTSFTKVWISVLGLVLLISVGKETSTWDYTPYSNSLYYICTKHLPYNYRSNYNVKANNVNLDDL